MSAGRLRAYSTQESVIQGVNFRKKKPNQFNPESNAKKLMTKSIADALSPAAGEGSPEFNYQEIEIYPDKKTTLIF